MGPSRLANPGLVPQGDAHVHDFSNQTGTKKNPPLTARKAREIAPAKQNPDTSSMPLVRQQLFKLNLPSDTIHIVLAS